LEPDKIPKYDQEFLRTSKAVICIGTLVVVICAITHIIHTLTYA